ncbi:MAG: HIT family protein, partial [Opitutales bacterium]
FCEGAPRQNPFVALAEGGDDREALILHRAEAHYVVLNRYPYNPGHCLVLPYREVARLDQLERTERAELMELLVQTQAALEAAMHPDGFNVGLNLGKTAGAGIPQHLHLHVVPRWDGDCNFMPVIGETRSLPQALEQTWEVLQPHFGSIPRRP